MSKKVQRIKIGNKEYSLNDIWRLCRRMWKDIKGANLINAAKEKWLEENGFYPDDIMACCFFCEWNEQVGDRDSCAQCPGKLVSPRFNCQGISYNHAYEPKKFEAKIARLDKKRKGK